MRQGAGEAGGATLGLRERRTVRRTSTKTSARRRPSRRSAQLQYSSSIPNAPAAHRNPYCRICAQLRRACACASVRACVVRVLLRLRMRTRVCAGGAGVYVGRAVTAATAWSPRLADDAADELPSGVCRCEGAVVRAVPRVLSIESVDPSPTVVFAHCSQCLRTQASAALTAVSASVCTESLTPKTDFGP